MAMGLIWQNTGSKCIEITCKERGKHGIGTEYETVKGSCQIGKKHRIMPKRHVVQKWKYHECTGKHQEVSYIELISDRRTMSIVK
eukprot:5584637-Heterocapsa_arctica.AAC.1